jgi:hypothetical protein
MEAMCPIVWSKVTARLGSILFVLAKDIQILFVKSLRLMPIPYYGKLTTIGRANAGIKTL